MCVSCKSFAVSLWHVSRTVCHKAELTIHQSSPVGDMNGRDVWHYLSVARHSGFVAVSVLPANWRQSPLQHAALDAVCAGIFCPYSGGTGIIFPRLASMTKKKLSRTGRTERSSRKNKMRDRHSERERKAKQTRGTARQGKATRRRIKNVVALAAATRCCCCVCANATRRLDWLRVIHADWRMEKKEAGSKDRARSDPFVC